MLVELQRPELCGYAVSQRIRKRIEEAFGWIIHMGRAQRVTEITLPSSVA